MAREWLQLGALMLPALTRARNQAVNRVPAALTSDRRLAAVLVSIFADAYLDGTNVAVVTHGARLGLTSEVVFGETTRGLIDRSLVSIASARDRALATFTQDATVAELTNYFAQAATNMVWQGQDDEAEVLATLATVEWKTWVRSFARDEHRDHHDDLNGVTIPVDDDFILPGGPNAGARCYGPRDWDSIGDPSEWMNCGHALEYKREATTEDIEVTSRSLETVFAPARTTRTDREIRASLGL